jgi:Tol biopolymer transport system component
MDEEVPLHEILYTTQYPGDYFRNLYVMRSDGSRPMRLTDDRSMYMEAGWSPDGSLITAVTKRPGTEGWTLWMHDRDGTILRRIGEAGWSLRDPEWMPDGSALLAAGTAPTDTVRNIYLVEPGGPIIRRVTDDSVTRRSAAPSPDGARLAVVSRRPGRIGYEIVIMGIDGGAARVVPGSGERGIRRSIPSWSPDGSRLAYIGMADTLDGPDELRILNVETGRTTVIGEMASTGGPRRRRLDWFPNDDALVLVTQRDGDTRPQTYCLDLRTGVMNRLSPGFEEAARATIGPVASSDRHGGTLVQPPLVLGPVLHPDTGHTYYAVFTARRLTWPQAVNAAKAMRHDGSEGYLASVTDENESRFLLREFPLTHHGFWLGGYGEPTGVAGGAYDWTWANGEPWGYAGWHATTPVAPDEFLPGATMTWSLRAVNPERAGAEDYYTLKAQSPWQEELGFIVEFDPPAVSSLP